MVLNEGITESGQLTDLLHLLAQSHVEKGGGGGRERGRERREGRGGRGRETGEQESVTPLTLSRTAHSISCWR